MRRLTALALVVVTAPQPASAGEVIERLESVVWIKTRGEVEVQETRVLWFDARPPRTIVYTVRTPYPMAAAFVSAALDGAEVALDGEPAAIPEHIRIVAAHAQTRLEWTLPPGGVPSRTLSISYLLWNRAAQDRAGDSIRWRIMPLFANGTIETASARFAFAATLVARPHLEGKADAAAVELSERGAFVTIRGVRAGQHIDIPLRFAPHAIAGTGLRWQRRRATRTRAAVAVLALTAGAMLTFLGVHAVRRRIPRRDQPVHRARKRRL